jgi:hypothetical protein
VHRYSRAHKEFHSRFMFLQIYATPRSLES